MAAQADENATADIVIVGGGTAGCVLAARLSESGKLHVALLEAGPSDTNPWINLPFGMQMLITNPKVNWMYESEPISGIGGRRVFQPRGKVIGGSGAINASLYVRGNRADFDEWRDAGCSGWGYEDVLPYFKKAEHQERGADEFHGVNGPMWVSDAPGDSLSRTFIAATRERGLPQNPDFNGREQEGFGRFQTSTRKKKRHSSARAYLDPARTRKNLRIITRARATRVEIRDGRVAGVHYAVGNRSKYIAASKEVILCGGVFNSPQLLELSGIGAGQHLQRLGIEVAVDLPGVGENLQEHFGTKSIFKVSDPAFSLNRIGHSLLRKAAIFGQYALTRSGPLAWTNTFAGGFARSSDNLAAPDIQVTANAWSALGFSREGMISHNFPGITFNAYHLRPESRGSVHIASRDPLDLPRIHLAALDTEYDRAAIRAGIRLIQDIVGTTVFAAVGAIAFEPSQRQRTNEELDAFAREKLVPMLHPVGTCRMGVDAAAVVDPELRVRGVSGLRVVDSSIMPTITRGNTNAATVMIAEKAARMIQT